MIEWSPYYEEVKSEKYHKGEILKVPFIYDNELSIVNFTVSKVLQDTYCPIGIGDIKLEGHITFNKTKHFEILGNEFSLKSSLFKENRLIELSESTVGNDYFQALEIYMNLYKKSVNIQNIQLSSKIKKSLARVNKNKENSGSCSHFPSDLYYCSK